MRIQSIQRESYSLLRVRRKCRDDHDGDEDGAEPDHDVIAEVEKSNLVRPLIFRESVKSLHLRAPMSVSQEAQHFGDFERIIELAFGNIGLAQNGNRRAFAECRIGPPWRQAWRADAEPPSFPASRR